MVRINIINKVDDLAKHPIKRYSKRDLAKIRYIVCHHFAGNISVEEAAKLHVSKGWPGIGYFSVIDFEGDIYRANHLDTRSYGVAGNNTACVSIALRGNYEHTTPPDCMVDSFCYEVDIIRDILGWKVPVKVHSDFKATACPGAKLRQIIRELYPEPAPLRSVDTKKPFWSWLRADKDHA